MLSRSKIVLTVLIVGIVSLTPAGALAASPQDSSSTHRALTAADTTLQAIVSTWPKEEASLHELNLRFGAECPHVAAGSPQNASEQKLSYEIVGALFATGYHTDAKIADAFIAAVSPLRWSNPAITRRLHVFINGLREMLALKVPNLCADVRSWIASGYQAVPASTLRFDEHVEAIEVEIPSPRLVAAFVQPADRGLFKQVAHLLTRFEELEFTTGQQDWIDVLETLSLNE
jgi:hypothetical protein